MNSSYLPVTLTNSKTTDQANGGKYFQNGCGKLDFDIFYSNHNIPIKIETLSQPHNNVDSCSYVYTNRFSNLLIS